MAETPSAARAQASPGGPGHEPDQPRLKGVLLGAASIIAGVIVAIVVALVLVHGLGEDETAEKPREPPPIVAGPRLQPAPEKDFPAFHQEKGRLLDQYAWVDRQRGIVRIPIRRAMALLVEQQGQREGAAR
jgi:hypothetical protein